MTRAKCGYCEGVVAFEPYVETIDGLKISFHAKA
jgi:hypothetical protein